MNNWVFVAIGYAIVFTSLAAYSIYVVQRGRQLAKQVSPERRRFLD